MGMVTAPFSYRKDPAVPAFDDTAPLIIFDGLCVLCSTGVQFMMKHDPNGSSRFAAIQDPIPRALYNHYNLDADRFDTFMVLADGTPHLKWQGVLSAAKTMGGFWKVLGIAGQVVPKAIGDVIYDVVQRNRLRWFGNRQTCLRPEAHQRTRFLTEHMGPL
jgi:predicted DCC family thiol-disulfide oxidoreductase YuxK